MNLSLQKEIVSHVFKTIGLFPDQLDFRSSFTENLIQDKFLLGKKLAFETENKEKHKNNIWAVLSKVAGSTIKLMIADISDGNSEYAVLIQMDNFAPHGLRLSNEDDDDGVMAVNLVESEWVNAGTIVQAKLLSGIESLAELLPEWKRLDDFDSLYKKLIVFLNSQES